MSYLFRNVFVLLSEGAELLILGTLALSVWCIQCRDCHIGATATFEKSPRVVQGYKVNIAAAVEDHMEQEFWLIV